MTSNIVPGAFVRLMTDPDRSGVVQAGKKTQAGMRMVQVQLGDGSMSWLPADNLETVTALPDLVERFSEGQFVAPEWLRRALTRIRVTGRLSDVVYSMEATETDFYAYQFKPVLKLLDSPTDALLIADEVGLGKTIEAGLIWTELRARLECNRLLVICPKTLCEKWRGELDRRFGVDARIVDAEELKYLVSRRRDSGRGFAAIGSMQGLRPPRGWDDEEESAQAGRSRGRLELARFLGDATGDEPLIDLLVVDEAHHMRNPVTLLHDLGQLLNAVSAHRVFLSATPIHLRNRDLHSLLRFIDPDTFEYENTLDKLIRVNEPIVAARDMLMRSDTRRAEIIERIEKALDFDLLTDNKSLQILRRDLESRPLDESTRADLSSRLERANQMANFMVRTRRRDVEEFRTVRDPIDGLLEMHEDEREFYEAVTREIEEYATECEANKRFLLSTPQRLLTSSPAAASAYWTSYEGEREGGQERIEETDDDLIQNDDDDRPLMAKIAVLTREINVTDRLEKVDTKFNRLLQNLHQIWHAQSDTKVIVFSSFKVTLRYLKRRLLSEGITCEMLHGSINDPRHVVLDKFRDDPSIRVLLSSEIGSEGIDLQFCWFIVNYDLPWNPMRLEQRIGRVDRLGQPKPVVKILNLIYDHTIDAIIYSRLYQRLELTKKAIGEFEAILGEPIREMTQRLLDPTLSVEQKAEVVEQTMIAVKRRRDNEKMLEEQAGALIRHGDYILEQINEARKLHRWLGGNDILAFVKDRLARSFSGCSIETSPPGSDTYRIILSRPAREALRSFIARRHLKGTTGLLEGSGDRRRYRFTSSVATRGSERVENISQVHTLVRFAAELDERDHDIRNAQPVAALVESAHLAVDRKLGVYVIAMRRWSSYTANDRANGTVRIAYAGASLDSSQLLPPDVCEAMAASAAEHGRLLPAFKHDERLPAAEQLLRTVVLEKLDLLYEEFVERTRADVEDRTAIQEKALLRHFQDQKDKLEERGDKHRNDAEYHRELGNRRQSQRLSALAAAAEGKLRRLEESFELRLTQINERRKATSEWSDVACLVLEVAK